ncbi:hypothetical protein BG003_002889 [Podila horticola]|nr:hypothetical protein BG003_002889 [Podila horticola]
MKFTLASILSVASVVLLSLSSVQSGLNNYACKLTKAYPRPVILVHATLLTLDSWKDFVPILVAAGYCPFALTYGKYGAFKQFGSLASIEQSAQELATFAEDVMARLKVSQVDLVGKSKCHSQGGSIGRYWVKYLGGRGKVNKMISVSPINHGTTLSNIVTIAKAFGVFTSGQATFDKIAPSFYQMVDTSSFIANSTKGVMLHLASSLRTSPPSMAFSHAMYDEVVTPFTSCYSEKAGVTNQLLQDLSKVVLRWIMNQLDPSTAETASCLPVF